ncbi:unnamed protein product, partial [Effrenium voratum]
ESLVAGNDVLHACFAETSRMSCGSSHGNLQRLQQQFAQQSQCAQHSQSAPSPQEPVTLPPSTPPELQEHFARLVQERRELKDYAERVTRELRRYQQSRPQPAASPDDDLPLPPWAANMQMMSPLLFAYEE